MKEYKEILTRVKTVIDDQDKIDNILNEYPNRSSETRDEYVKNRETRIKNVLNLAGLKSQKDYDLYVEAL